MTRRTFTLITMPKQFMQHGPWPGGINTRDDATSISEVELVDCTNFDIELSGALIPRRGWEEVAVTAPALKITPITVYYGIFNVPKAVFARATNINPGTEATSFFSVTHNTYADLRNNAGAVFSRTGLFYTAFNMDGKIYFVPDQRSQAAPVGFSLNDLTNQDPVSIPAMPAGQFSFVLNDRAFIFNPKSGRLYWSKATDPTVWVSPDGGWVDIDPSDEPFTDCVVVRTTAYFIRGNGIYAFTFSSDPGIDGAVVPLANSEGAVMGAAYQNELYLATPRGLFKFLNGYLTLISDRVSLGVVGGLPAYSDNNGMSVIEHTLWVRSWDGSNIHHYAFNLQTGGASRYDHTNLTEIYGKSVSDTQYTYFNAGNKVVVVTNKRSPTAVTANGKSFGYSFTTRRDQTAYSRPNRRPWGSRLIWKRLISWFVDYNSGTQFADGNNLTQFFVRANGESDFNSQATYTGLAKVTSNSMEGRVDTPSLRYKDVQFGLESVQIGAVNPAGLAADAGITIRHMMVYYSTSRDVSTLVE